MYYSKTDGYRSDTDSIEINSIIKPLGALTDAERKAAGYEDVVIDRYPSELDRTHIVTEVKDGTHIGYTATPRPLEQVKEMKRAVIATYRYQIEIGGCVLGGARIATDDRAKVLLNGAYNRAKGSDPTATRKFKTPGGFVDLTNAQIVAMAEAIADHVQACYDAEALHCAAINAVEDNAEDPVAPLLEVIEYDHTVGWPANQPAPVV